MKSIVVWDLPTRAFHWALVASVILALIIIEDEGLAYTIHAILGVAALVLVLFRLVWGFAGGERARFTDF
ncbi:MAG: cytochrome b/b6 domain-containing protein, partial [Alphaproteobacteria bacterium]|nr:cytochrome b/b6 domain-containing protein [Alphaproteobacteria bacterium]